MIEIDVNDSHPERNKMPGRRPSVTERVIFTTATGSEFTVTVTFGFDNVTGRVRELFCASFKSGTDANANVMDGCVCLSLLLQHGYTPKQLAAKLCSPPSILGTLMLAAARIDEEATPMQRGLEPDPNKELVFIVPKGASPAAEAPIT